MQQHTCLQALADKVRLGIITHHGHEAYNGVHMRMEKDALDWAIILGGRAKLWHMYKHTMMRAHFDAHTPLYVASGLIKASATDPEPRKYMTKLSRDLVLSGVRFLHLQNSAWMLLACRHASSHLLCLSGSLHP